MKKLLLVVLCFSMVLFSADRVQAYTDPNTISVTQLQTAFTAFKSRCDSNFSDYLSDGAYFYIVFRANGSDEYNVAGSWYCICMTHPYTYFKTGDFNTYDLYPQLNNTTTAKVAYMVINSTGSYTLPKSIYNQSDIVVNLQTGYVAYSSVSISDANGNLIHDAISLTGTYWGMLVDATPTPTPTVTPIVTPTPTPIPDTGSDDNSSLIDALLTGIKDIFVPDSDYFSTKFSEIQDRFKWTDSVVLIFKNTIGALVSTDEPPVIKITGKSGTALNFGEVVLMDFSWYEPYRETVNNLLSAIIYLFYFWNLYKRLPDIISGVGMITIYDSKIQNYNDNKKSSDD